MCSSTVCPPHLFCKQYNNIGICQEGCGTNNGNCSTAETCNEVCLTRGTKGFCIQSLIECVANATMKTAVEAANNAITSIYNINQVDALTKGLIMFMATMIFLFTLRELMKMIKPYRKKIFRRIAKYFNKRDQSLELMPLTTEQLSLDQASDQANNDAVGIQLFPEQPSLDQPLQINQDAASVKPPTDQISRVKLGDDDDVDVEKLWSKKELEKKLDEVKEPAFLRNLSDEKQKEVQDKVVILLLTVNKNETYATRSFLKPLDGHEDTYEFSKRVVHGVGRLSHHAIYYIGKFGSCPVAITTVSAGARVQGGTINVPMIAYETFPNLGAIIAVGVACGIEKKTRMCDVMVSTQIVDYTQARIQKGGMIPRGAVIYAAPYLQDLFCGYSKWLDDAIKQRIKNSKMSIPEIIPGVILSGPYLIDDPEFKHMLIEAVAVEAIGIEMEGAYLFSATQGTTTSVIIVKAVCDFGDGKKNKKYQPTAAFLAATYVHKILQKPQIPDDIRHGKVSGF